MKKIIVVYNPSSGGNDGSKQEIKEVFARSGASLQFIKIGNQLERRLKRAADTDAKILVASGGDGTVNAVAGCAVKLSLPMGILPTGTLNHFAKDAGLPLTLKQAAAVIIKGKTTQVDYCTVNNRVFLNNSSIGLYPTSVLKRQSFEPKVGKWPAAFMATLHAILRVRTTRLSFSFGGQQEPFRTSLVFVGNNSYEFHKLGFTNRRSLTSGKLYLYVVRTSRPRAILRLAVLLFFGKRWKSKDYLNKTQTEITITSPKKVLNVALDGEVTQLKTPLHYKICPKGLTIFCP